MIRKQNRNSTRTSSTQQDIGKDLIQLVAHFVSFDWKTARIEKRNRCKINKTYFFIIPLEQNSIFRSNGWNLIIYDTFKQKLNRFRNWGGIAIELVHLSAVISGWDNQTCYLGLAGWRDTEYGNLNQQLDAISDMVKENHYN